VTSQIIGFLRDLGWGVTMGIVVLLIGGAIFYFLNGGKTKNKKAERSARDTAGRKERS
jgi:hypothetical protein